MDGSMFLIYLLIAAIWVAIMGIYAQETGDKWHARIALLGFLWPIVVPIGLIWLSVIFLVRLVRSAR